eukprot:1158736-Pelagomonas_calceolata.AAC.4
MADFKSMAGCSLLSAEENEQQEQEQQEQQQGREQVETGARAAAAAAGGGIVPDGKGQHMPPYLAFLFEFVVLERVAGACRLGQERANLA